jgi:uncharacterized protein (DUF58 family)
MTDHVDGTDLPYRLPWRSAHSRVGAHRSKIEGTGGYFRDVVPLVRNPDPRRIDVRISARDPFEGLHVRRFEQMAAVTVYVLVDVSASMGFRGSAEKLGLAANLSAALAASARRVGDAFGLIGCDEVVRPELTLLATRARGSEAELLKRLRSFVPQGRSAMGLRDAAALVAGRRKLVFVISDFFIPNEEVEGIFAALAHHDIVPILLADSAELEKLPRWGILSLTDLEVGRRRLVVMRPRLRDAWLRRSGRRRADLKAMASRYAREPFIIDDRINWERFAGYLMGGAA